MPQNRSGKFLLILLGLILFNSVFLAVSNRLPAPPRSPAAAFFYMGNVMLHVLLGVVALLVMIKAGRAWGQSIRQTGGIGRAIGLLSALALCICVAAGIGLFIFGNLRPMDPVLKIHGIGALAAAIFGAFWLLARSGATEERRAPKLAASLISLAVIPGLL